MGDGLIRSLGDSLDVREFQQGFTEDLLNIYIISTEDLPKIKTYSRFAKVLLKEHASAKFFNLFSQSRFFSPRDFIEYFEV